MNGISVGPAISAGFRLVGREPLTFLAWCAIYFAMTAVPMIFTWSDTAAYYKAIGDGASITDPSIQPPFGIWEWVSIALSVVMMVCLPAAVMRAMLHPEDRQFFYFRIGAREMWLAVASIMVFLLWVAAYVAVLMSLGLIGGIIGAGLGADGGGDAGGAVVFGLLMLILIPVLFAAGVWVWVRLSMATTMSFAEKRLRVFASWRFTKGNGLRIFLVALSLFAITVLALGVLVGGSLAALAASLTDGASLETFFAQIARASLPALLTYTAAVSVAFVGMSVIGAASWADMYRQLRPTVADTFD